MERPLLIEHDSKLYDVSAFASKHPGGDEVLRQAGGADVSKIMRGEEPLLGRRHEHSKAAYEILRKYAIDYTQEQDPLLDSKKAILWKVGELGSKYWKWVHHPHDGTLRLFESDVLERMTRTAWWVVPLSWMPMVVCFALYGLSELCGRLGNFNGAMLSTLLFALGLLSWTLLEYGLHRGVFHWHPNPQSYTQITLHFLLHGLHHKTPMDPDRLVFPPVPAAMIVAVFYVFYSSILPFPIFCCFCSGKLFGYITYDMVHYYLHHGTPKPNSGFHFKKIYHHNHHFKCSDSGYGISTQLWDYVFETTGTGPLI